MIVTLEEAKGYLRVDYDDDDALIGSIITAAENVVADVARMPTADIEKAGDDNIRLAVLYAIAYMFEHREEADHHALVLNLRYLLFGVRKAAF